MFKWKGTNEQTMNCITGYTEKYRWSNPDHTICEGTGLAVRTMSYTSSWNISIVIIFIALFWARNVNVKSQMT
jgi:hypothetical protein